MNEDESEKVATEPATTESAKRERATYPIRLLMRGADGGFRLVDGQSFDTIVAAERHVRNNGEDDAVYMLARVIGARSVQPRKIAEVSL